MKVRTIVGIVSMLTVTSVFAAEQTWTGAISDKMCGADHTKMANHNTDRDCTLACAKGGSAYVLVSDGKVYQLTNQNAELRTHAGHTVNLTGELKGDTIRVSKIEMPKS